MKNAGASDKPYLDIYIYTHIYIYLYIFGMLRNFLPTVWQLFQNHPQCFSSQGNEFSGSRVLSFSDPLDLWISSTSRPTEEIQVEVVVEENCGGGKSGRDFTARSHQATGRTGERGKRVLNETLSQTQSCDL